jgi:glycosyltransferase involved in cell wall biosynthesis
MYYPKISIVTPSYNQAQFLERTILSVINQNYPNLEYIIIDGGSTDGSVDIIKKYGSKLSYWISEKDNGQSDALNKGFAKATGEIYAYLNSDDIYLRSTLETISNTFLKISDADLIYGNANLIDEKDNKIGNCIALPFKIKEYLNGIFSIPQPSSFWKRNVYEKVGGFNINNHTCMDAEFYALANELKFKFLLINKVFSSFRLHPKSKTADKSASQLQKNFNDQQKIINNFRFKYGFNVNSYLNYFYRLKYIPYKLLYVLTHTL